MSMCVHAAAAVYHAFLCERAQGDTVPKSLHVSPLIDMNRCWRLKASAPANALLVDGRWYTHCIVRWYINNIIARC